MSNENGGATTLVNVVFSHNRANDHGGGMVNNSAATLINVVFSANSAGIYGGGMTNYGDSTLINVTFNGNSAGSAGGGLYNFWATPALTNAILWGNSALTGPGNRQRQQHCYHFLQRHPGLRRLWQRVEPGLRQRWRRQH